MLIEPQLCFYPLTFFASYTVSSALHSYCTEFRSSYSYGNVYSELLVGCTSTIVWVVGCSTFQAISYKDDFSHDGYTSIVHPRKESRCKIVYNYLGLQARRVLAR